LIKQEGRSWKSWRGDEVPAHLPTPDALRLQHVKYQPTIAKLPLVKDIDDFLFVDTPGGNFIAEQRNVVLVGGAGTGKTHLAIALARA
jgi:DNA replication protein DnaC